MTAAFDSIDLGRLEPGSVPGFLALTVPAHHGIEGPVGKIRLKTSHFVRDIHVRVPVRAVSFLALRNFINKIN